MECCSFIACIVFKILTCIPDESTQGSLFLNIKAAHMNFHNNYIITSGYILCFFFMILWYILFKNSFKFWFFNYRCSRQVCTQNWVRVVYKISTEVLESFQTRALLPMNSWYRTWKRSEVKKQRLTLKSRR